MTLAFTRSQGPVLTGRTIGERYALHDRLARGGAADVYAATDARLGREVAVKVLSLDGCTCSECQVGGDADAEAEPCGRLARFAHEAAIGARIDDPHVVETYDAGVDRSGPTPLPYLVMPRVAGRNLRTRILSGPLHWRSVSTFGRQLLAGLAAIHEQGVLHGDLKPENCMICERSGREPYLRLIDLGEAVAVRASGVRPVCTVAYTAPERILGQEVGVQADIYAVGVILYEMLCRRQPFVGTDEEVIRGHLRAPPRPPSEMIGRSAVPRPLEQLVLAAMSKDPRHRLASASSFERALELACPDVRQGFVGEMGQSDRFMVGHSRLGSAGFPGLSCSATHAGCAQAQASLAAWTRFEYEQARHEAEVASALNRAWSPLRLLMSLAPEE